MFYTSISLFAAQNDLQEKLAKLQTLPKSERFILMNEIKKELARMNAEQRQSALKKLRASMHKQRSSGYKGQNGQGKHEGLHLQTGLGTQQHQNIQHQPIQRDQSHMIGQSNSQRKPSPQPQMGSQHGRK